MYYLEYYYFQGVVEHASSSPLQHYFQHLKEEPFSAEALKRMLSAHPKEVVCMANEEIQLIQLKDIVSYRIKFVH